MQVPDEANAVPKLSRFNIILGAYGYCGSKALFKSWRHKGESMFTALILNVGNR